MCNIENTETVVPAEYIEIAEAVLDEAAKEFETVDRRVLIPMADHIECALKRIKSGDPLENPLNDDIRMMYQKEYKAAEKIARMLEERMGIQIPEDEIGYVAIHVHSAVTKQDLSQTVKTADAVRQCIDSVEKAIGREIAVTTLSYERLMNHVQNMAERAESGEKLKLSMNDYMKVKFPETFQMAAEICEIIGTCLGCKLDEVEIGYLAIHIERIVNEVLTNTAL